MALLRIGSEFLINTTTVNYQDSSSVTALADGRFVVTWTDSSQSGGDTSGNAVRGRVFNADGSQFAPEFLVNTATASYQSDSCVTALADGRFVVTWSDGSESGGDTHGIAVRGRIFNANGSQFAPEFLVNSTIAGYQGESSVTALANGRFVVTWTDTSASGGDTSGYAVRGRIFNADGTEAAPEFLVNAKTAGDQLVSCVTAMADGRFVVTWTDTSASDGDTSLYAVRGRIFNADGSQSAPEFLVNTTTTNFQSQSSITALADGRFVVTWNDFSQSGGDTSGYAVRGRIFNADGTEAAPEFLVNAKTAGDQSDSCVTALADGRFVVTWTDSASGGDTSSYAVRGRVFNADSSQSAPEFLVNTTTTNYQYDGSVKALADGRFVVTWTDGSVDGDIRAQIFDSDGTPTTLETSEQLFNGNYLLTMASFDRAAYCLAPWEPTTDNFNDVSPGALAEFNDLADKGWHFLGAEELGMDGTRTTLGSGFVSDFQDGVFTYENAAALVAVSSDALVISFRGTNDGGTITDIPRTPDVSDWFDMSEHYGHFAALIAAINSYVSQHGIRQVYVTGHSLGAAMVERFMRDHQDNSTSFPLTKFDAVTFASPGYYFPFVIDPGQSRIESFRNIDDPIYYNPVNEPIGDRNLIYFGQAGVEKLGYVNNQHSMALYLAIIEEMSLSGVPDAAFFNGAGWRKYDAIVTNYELINESLNQYTVALGDDTLHGNKGLLFQSHDLIFGGQGSDKLFGWNGDDALFGGADSDILVGGQGADRIDGGAGTGDTADYRTSTGTNVNISLLADTASGGHAAGDALDGIENLMGSLTLRDVLIGDNAANKLEGFGGADSLRGEAGDDYLDGGAGADALNGGAGANDWAGYRTSTVGTVSINLLTAVHSGGDAQGDTLFFIENLEGSLTKRDILIGNIVANRLVGNGGVDSLLGGDGNDFLEGGTGGDSLNGGAGIDTASYQYSSEGVTIDLAVALQTSLGDAAGESLNFVENIDGSVFADSLTGNYQSNTLRGGFGTDILNGGAGSDYLTGGDDADTFRFSGLSFGADTITDWDDGVDLISIALPLETSFAGLTFSGNGTTSVIVRGFNGTGSAIIVKADLAFSLDAGDFMFV